MLLTPDKPIKADYKIEIHFGKNRTVSGPNICAVMVLDSGKQLNGDGDGLLYICAEKDRGLDIGNNTTNNKTIKKGKQGCGGVIPNDRMAGGIAHCPHCDSLIKSSELTSVVYYRATPEDLAKRIEKLFVQLNHSADIYLKYHPTDIRAKALQNSFGLEDARSSRGLTIYPLANILKDTSAGASIKQRFKALFTA